MKYVVQLHEVEGEDPHLDFRFQKENGKLEGYEVYCGTLCDTKNALAKRKGPHHERWLAFEGGIPAGLPGAKKDKKAKINILRSGEYTIENGETPYKGTYVLKGTGKLTVNKVAMGWNADFKWEEGALSEPQEAKLIWESKEKEIWHRVRESGECTDFHRVNFSKGVAAIRATCGDNKVITGYRFSKQAGWTMDRAKKWAASHKPQTGKNSMQVATLTVPLSGFTFIERKDIVIFEGPLLIPGVYTDMLGRTNNYPAEPIKLAHKSIEDTTLNLEHNKEKNIGFFMRSYMKGDEMWVRGGIYNNEMKGRVMNEPDWGLSGELLYLNNGYKPIPDITSMEFTGGALTKTPACTNCRVSHTEIAYLGGAQHMTEDETTKPDTQVEGAEVTKPPATPPVSAPSVPPVVKPDTSKLEGMVNKTTEGIDAMTSRVDELQKNLEAIQAQRQTEADARAAEEKAKLTELHEKYKELDPSFDEEEYKDVPAAARISMLTRMIDLAKKAREVSGPANLKAPGIADSQSALDPSDKAATDVFGVDLKRLFEGGI